MIARTAIQNATVGSGRDLTRKLVLCALLASWCMAAGAAYKEWTAGGGESNWLEPSGWVPAGVPNNGDVVMISADIIVTGTTAQLAGFTNCAMVTFGGTNSILKSTEIFVDDAITHYPQSATDTNPAGDWVMDNRVWISCSNLTVSTNGSINVASNGYAHGYGPGADPRLSLPNRCQASHGGLGQGTVAYPAGPIYGSVSAPIQPGSGGGDASTGQSGGGAVYIQATGAVTVNGTISADGGYGYAGYRYVGGGSGGSILIECASIEGSGRISALGSKTWEGYGGGGGRIAVMYDSVAQSNGPMPTITFDVQGERGGPAQKTIGCPGTLYFPDATFYPYARLEGGGDVVIPGLTSWGGSSQIVDNAWVRFSSESNLTFAGELVVTGEYGRVDCNQAATGYMHVACSDGITLTGGGCFYLYSGPTNDTAVRDYGARLTVQRLLSIYSNSTMCLVSEPTNGGSAFLELENLYVYDGGELSADTLGYGYGQGPGFPGGRGGAGHGGTGGNGSFGAGGGVYGSSNSPIAAGSGCVRANEPGGGGVIRIESPGRLTIDGILTADGCMSPGRYGGGPSGGSIWIQASRLQGDGVIRARGGNGHAEGGGGGGGGRIAVEIKFNFFTGTLVYPDSVAGGAGGTVIAADDGEDGTLVLTILPSSGTVFSVY